MPSTYDSDFELGATGSLKRAKALEYALQTRMFEIELYWKRATYFWTLIAVAFAGYFAVLAAEKMLEREFNAYVIACIGVVFSLAWFLVNRGSKFWQENWEAHVDMLENPVSGPLYKTVLSQPRVALIGAAPISVTRVNVWISLFTLFVWVFLMIASFPEARPPITPVWKYTHVTIIVIAACGLLIGWTQSQKPSSRALIWQKRSVSITET